MGHIVCAVAAVVSITAAITGASPAIAQDYPARPIRFIVPFPAGGLGDVVARVLGQRLTEAWGQQVVIDNRAGAGGTIGVQTAARATADGYTLVLGTSSTHATGPALYPDVPYDPVRDFAPISLSVLIPNILVAHPSVPVHSIKELIQLAKSRPGQITFASNGTGTSSHIAGELLKRAAGIDLVHVPYKGAGIAINDALGGHVQLLFGGISTSLPHVKTGRLRALAVTSLTRSAAAPDVPTVAEQGLPGFEVVHWMGALAPATTPKPLVTRLHAEMARAVSTPEQKERFARLGLDSVGGTPEQFTAFIKAEIAKWSKLFREAGIKGEQVR